MKFDDLLTLVGEFGPYQRRIYFLICFVAIPCAIQQLSQMFHDGSFQDHWCAVESYSDDVDRCYKDHRHTDVEKYRECIHRYRNITIPMEGEVHSQCKRYSDITHQVNLEDGLVPVTYTVDNQNDTGRPTERCDNGWVQDKSNLVRTINSDVSISAMKVFPRISPNTFLSGCCDEIVNQVLQLLRLPYLFSAKVDVNDFA